MNFLNTFWYNTSGASSFETKWRTSANNQSITLPYESSGTYSGTIDWGDGTVVANTYANRTHTYATGADYNVIIDGECSKWNFQAVNTSSSKIIEVLGWGTYSFETCKFTNCNSFIGGPVCRDLINLSPSADLSFQNCGQLTTIQNIEFWDISNLTNTAFMFQSCAKFTGDLSNWNMSNVTNAFFMFTTAKAFNSDVSSWDTSSITNFTYMFANAESFNSDINFDLTSATNNAYGLFTGCISFNGDVSGMDTSTLTATNFMFNGCTSLNNNSMMGWDVSNVEDMTNMFASCDSFDQDFTTWDTSNVETMFRMFSGATVFNGTVSVFDTSSVRNMTSMFQGADLFNQPIGNWNVSNVTNMEQMFYEANDFNQDISNWDVSKVNNFKGMFQGADDFDKPLTNWDIVSLFSLTMENFMFGKTFNNYSATNYDILLSRCENGGLSNITLDMGTIKYTISGQQRKNYLVNTKGWTISDGGLV